MGEVYVSDLESCSVSGKTAGTQGAESSLMCKLCQRIDLIHELGQLVGAEELSYYCDNRLDGNKIGRPQCLGLLKLHSVLCNVLDSCKSNLELVCKELADRTDTSVSKMVDVVRAFLADKHSDKESHGADDVIHGKDCLSGIVYL